MVENKELKKSIRAPSGDRARETVSAPSSDRPQTSTPKKPVKTGN